MMKKKNLLILLAASMLQAMPVNAKITMPAIFGDGMLLQQQTEANIWGKTDAQGKKITITTSWNKKKYTVSADKDGNWKTKISTPVYGGPYEITISDGETLKIKNVEIGEVWLCAGQSNMEMCLWGRRGDVMEGAMDAIVTKANPQIRTFNVPHNMKSAPVYDSKGIWQEANTETLPTFPAGAYFFAKKIHEVLGIPIGLVHTSVGGSSIQAWMSKESMQPFMEDSIMKMHGDKSILFNGMLSSVIGYTIKGALWYQGEANREEPDLYVKLFPTMVADWRKLWGQGDFPFYYAQIAPFNYNKGEGKGQSSAYLREAQTKCLDLIPNSGMAILTDIGEARTIHPRNKQDVGKRFAYLALGNTYGVKGFTTTGPIYKSMVVNGNEAELSFINVDKCLLDYHTGLKDFEIAGEDRVFHPAQARYNKDKTKVIVSSSEVAKPVAVRYAFKDYVEGTLFNNLGLPATSFRTDNW